MPLTILLVDDDPLMHRMLVPRLRTMGTAATITEILTAQTPEAALDALGRVGSGPLAVVSDFNLKAAMNGLQLLARVRSLRPDALRVLLSGYSLEQLGDVQQSGDAHAFLEKPLILDDLVGPLARLIDERVPAD